MKKLLFTGLFAALIVVCFAQKPYKVVFYNFENLFDTIRNPEIYDEEFTPEGPKKWNRPSTPKRSITFRACCSTSPLSTRTTRW